MNFYHLFRTGNNELLYIVPLNAVTLENCATGLSVQRGRDWHYGSQDDLLGSHYFWYAANLLRLPTLLYGMGYGL